MTDSAEGRATADRESRSWVSQIPLIILTALVGAIFTLGAAYGTRWNGAGDATLILTTKVDQLIEQNKGQDAKLFQLDANSREGLVKLGTLVTREEFSRFNDAAERRFQRQDQQINDLTRRLDGFEMIVRSLIDRTSKR
jgi:hypothetical protein